MASPTSAAVGIPGARGIMGLMNTSTRLALSGARPPPFCFTTRILKSRRFNHHRRRPPASPSTSHLWRREYLSSSSSLNFLRMLLHSNRVWKPTSHEEPLQRGLGRINHRAILHLLRVRRVCVADGEAGDALLQPEVESMLLRNIRALQETWTTR